MTASAILPPRSCLILAALLLCLSLVGCGNKGPLRQPEASATAGVRP